LKTNPQEEDVDSRVISILEAARTARRSGDGYRLRIYYGDPSTGRSWGDGEAGYIGRSTGSVKIPLILANSKSSGGAAILVENIIKVEYANKKLGGVLYDVNELRSANNK